MTRNVHASPSDTIAHDFSAFAADEASFKANIGKVLGNCKACHDNYREKK